MANLFRKFIPNFALIAAPLYELTKDKVPFIWGSRQADAFQSLKSRLSSKPCLAFPQDKEFILHTDESQMAVGAALFQQQPGDDAKLTAIGYFSKTLSDTQRKWSPTHIELFVMIRLRFMIMIYDLRFYDMIYDHLPESDDIVEFPYCLVFSPPKTQRFPDDTPKDVKSKWMTFAE
ncbi:hypothetical protein ANCCEY_12702 [Ancylostoma ceylanicum]|uniref:Reverse transcriptase/retrotransposon-derived protein RNase H-like domain-containing protein n=1 Tax=Ancylostoma ceylanicum TaxID=53326 RepID=A0A0D6LE49_9BILA|nr:hypothetical protein ANCCEY_12702 [Ancylostoma ceylanicum]